MMNGTLWLQPGGGVEALLLAVVDGGVRGVLLLGGVLLAAGLLRGASAATRHALIGAGLVVLLSLPFGSLLPWRIPVVPDWSGDSGAPVANPGPSISLSSPVPSGGLELFPDSRSEPRAVIGAAAESPRSLRVRLSGLTATHFVLALWLTGMGVVGLRMLIGHRRVRSLLRDTQPVSDPSWLRLFWEAADRLEVEEDVRLLMSSRSLFPFTEGAIEPTVVLPRGADAWDDDRRRAVLMHELAHIRRRDIIVHQAARAACLLYWFDPLVWIAARRLRLESERAADDLVLEGGARPSDYADHLLQIVSGARLSPMPGGVLPFARRRDFEGRILAILEPRLPRTQLSRVQVGGLVLGVVALALPVAALTASAADDQGVPSGPLVEEPAPGAGLAPRGPIADRDGSFGANVPDQDRRVRDGSGGRGGAGRGGRGPSLDDPRAIAALIQLLQDDPVPEVRMAAARGLAELDADEAVEALSVAVLEDSDAEVRATAAWALGEIEDERGVDALIAAMADQDMDVRRAAARALEELESNASLAGLVMALSDPDPAVRRIAARTIGDLDIDAAPPELIAALVDEVAEVRTAAARSLGDLEDPAAATALAAALDDPVREVRSAALDALVELRSEAAIDALIAALQDEDPAVRRRAAEALGDL